MSEFSNMNSCGELFHVTKYGANTLDTAVPVRGYLTGCPSGGGGLTGGPGGGKGGGGRCHHGGGDPGAGGGKFGTLDTFSERALEDSNVYAKKSGPIWAP